MVATLTPTELAALPARPAPHAVLDLRERGAYETGHVFRATSLPRRELEFRLPGLVSALATPLAVYDAGDGLGDLALATLAEMGYRDVRLLAGGLPAWRAAGHPVVQGLNVPSKVFGEQTLHQRRTPEVSAPELATWLAGRRNLVIVDARTPEEYAWGCVPGAWSVPGGELVLRIAELAPRPETTIVVHCGGRTRSYVGAESLRRVGLPNPVVALQNGTMGWELAGFALERGAARRAPPVSPEGLRRATAAAHRVAAEDRIDTVSPGDLRVIWERRDRENVYLFDVRTREEFDAGHLPGAVWAPGGQLVQATDDHVAVRAAAIVLVCDGLVRSTMTASWLTRMGLPRVLVLAGGIPAWLDAGGALETGPLPSVPVGYARARAVVPRVTAAELARVHDPARPPTILDVDRSDRYAAAHVPGAGWLCRSRLERLVPRLTPDPRSPLVLTCADGLLSTLAAETLHRLGYSATRALDGGTRAWEAAGQAVERGPTRLLDTPDDVVTKPYERGPEAMVAYLRWEEALDAEGRSPHALIPTMEGRS